MAVRLAVYTLLCLCLGTVAGFDSLALFDNYNFLLTAHSYKLKSGKDTRRACTYNYNIGIHIYPSVLFSDYSIFVPRSEVGTASE